MRNLRKSLSFLFVAATALTFQACAEEVKTGTEFQDCEDCPVMVTVPRGEFIMGAVPQDEEATKREYPNVPVKVDYDLAVGKYEITYGEFTACVVAGGCSNNLKAPKIRIMKDGKITGELMDPSRYPAVNVSWHDAQQYVRWLSRKTGRAYRLPTEAEWEYAARGGTTTIFWWGDEVGVGNAFCADCLYQLKTRDYSLGAGSEPTFVGQLPPNPYGLHDTSGNVDEWVYDCVTPTVQGNTIAQIKDKSYPSKCKAYPEDLILHPSRVLRGSTISSSSKWIRNSAGGSAGSNYRNFNVGFRIVTDDFTTTFNK